MSDQIFVLSCCLISAFYCLLSAIIIPPAVCLHVCICLDSTRLLFADAQGMVDHVPAQLQHKLLQPGEAECAGAGAGLRSGKVAARLTWAIDQAR